MHRAIAALTFMLLVSFPATRSLATNMQAGPLLAAPQTSDDLAVKAGQSENILCEAPDAGLHGRYTLQPNIRFTEKADLKSFCFSPVDTVTHYIGANIGEEEEAQTNSSTEPLEANPQSREGSWTVQFGAGVERQLSKRAAFDIDYRYSSSPVELDFDTLQLPSGHEHHISAGMKLFF